MTLNRRQLFRLVGAGAALSSLGTTAAVAAQPKFVEPTAEKPMLLCFKDVYKRQVFGLYPDYVNTIEVTYTRIDAKGEKKDIKESYQVYAPPVYGEVNGSPSLKSTMFDTTVVKVDPKYKDRLYLVNNLLTAPSKGARFIWNNPTGGAIEWTFYPQNAIIDTTGAVRCLLYTSQCL